MNKTFDPVKPTGDLVGDDKGMPDKGTGTGLNGDTYGADLGQDSTNRMGSIKGSSQSDPMDETIEEDPALGRKDSDD